MLSRLALETGRMVEYLGVHFDAAMKAPLEGPDSPLLHALARGVHGGSIDRQQALGIAVVMFGAGGESTAALIGSVIRAVAENPDIAQTLRHEPDKISNFIEEIIRLEPPFKFHYRAVRSKCQLGEADLEPGDRLMLVWASANRDEAIFEEPNSIRLDRRFPKRHMSFGRGGHFCIGAALARLEARVILDAILEGTSRIALRTNSRPEYANSIFIRRHSRLELTVDSAPFQA